MAAINYDINVNANQAVQSLQNLQNQVAKTSDVFASMKSAIAGFAAASFIQGLYSMANEITDMAAATGVGTQAILGFGKAVKANGGTMEGATTGIAKFVQKIGEAADGSQQAQDLFLKLGVSLNDLKTLSEEDLLKKAISGFKEGTNASERLSIAVALFGKAARSWDMARINAELEQYIAKSKEAAAATDSAGEASQQFSNAYGQFKTELLKALKPLSDLALLILENKQAVGAFLSTMANLAIAFAAFAGVKKIVGYLAELKTALNMNTAAGGSLAASLGVTEAVAGFQGGMKVIKREWSELGAVFARFRGVALFAELGSSIGAMAGGFLRMIPLIGQIVSLFLILNGLVEALTGKSIVGWAKSAAEALGLYSEEAKSSTDESKKQAERLREVNDAMAKQKIALDKITEAYREANAEANRKYAEDTKLLSLGELSKATYDKQLDSYSRYIAEYNKLKDQLTNAQASGSESEKGMVGGIITHMNELTAAYRDQVTQDEALAKARVEMTRATNLADFATKSLTDSQVKLQDIQDEMAKSTMGELEKKYYDIEASAKATARAAIAQEEARRKEKMPIEEQQKYYDAALQGTEDLRKATEASYKNSRTWATGWKQAFADYADNAYNAATEAKRVFDIMTQGMEDALMNFFKKGKFQWKDFVQSMVDELLRSQIRQLMANIMGIGSSAASGGGSLLGKIFGFASGGIIGTNGPVLVGERGPEILSGVGGRTVTPNDQIGTGTNVTYNISAVDAQSFKAMIARDPAFLYSVTQLGARTIPGGA